MDSLDAERADRYWYLHGEHVPVGLSSPAAGAALSLTVPRSVEWEIRSLSFTYTADGNAANRLPFLSILDQSGVAVASIATPYKLVASDASRITFAVGVNQFGADSAARIGCGIPPLWLTDGMSFTVSATGIQVGDTIGTPRLFVCQRRIVLD